jgi:hypothetical protein
MLAGTAACAAMLFSESIVNVAILLLLLAACCGRDIHHSGARKQQVKSAAIKREIRRLAGTEPFLEARQNGAGTHRIAHAPGLFGRKLSSLAT